MSNINILSSKELILPSELIKKYPIDNSIHQFVISTRKEVEDIINGKNDRLLNFSPPLFQTKNSCLQDLKQSH